MKLIKNCQVAANVEIMDFVNLYECEIDEDAFIGPFVEIQRHARIGRKTRISSHTFICEGVVIGENCFIGHGVMFINDKFDTPIPNGGNYILRNTTVGNNVRIGSNATILPISVGDHAVIGAGAVVTHDVPPYAVVTGNPARVLSHKNNL